ncbi:HdeD family acid-resistance protein [Arthrobacter sp. RAF14]|uniref:HdeD family acid-resistance protein n=1 Tax=Arthrobacter sp. RAF14 TaxID=3233051 RepID=UPI003F93E793
MSEFAGGRTAAEGFRAFSRALIGLGLLSIVLGLIIWFWPGASLLVLAVFFAINVFATGVARLMTLGRIPSEPKSGKVLYGILGVLTVLAGVLLIFRPGESLVVVAVLLAAGWILEGVALLWAGVASAPGAKALPITMGVLFILAGLGVALFPLSSLVFLAVWAGVSLVILGVGQLVYGIRLNKAAREAVSTTGL